MFPPDSPQSPLDGPLLIPQQPENDTSTTTSIQLRKPSDTLRNNIDFKEEMARKRTSLKIENNQNSNTLKKSAITNGSNSPSPNPTDEKTLMNKMGSLRNDNDIINNHHHHHHNDNDNNDNNNKRHRISMTSSSNDDDEGDYNDLENGNTTDTQSHKTRDSIISSEDFNVEEMNSRNNRLSEEVQSMTGLLSPDEGPQSRRYAEIACFKNWSDNNTSSHHLRTRHAPIVSIDIDDGIGGVGLIDDDLQALLPATHGISRDDLSQSRASLVSSSDGGILAEGESSSESSGGSNSPPCDLGLVERLLLTHPVWFLPGIQRAGAVHLLQGKEEGNFIVRGSSQTKTMAVSVRLPPNTGPYIEHYLIQSNESVLSLESSRFKFDSIPSLIAHYAQCCDELPVQLTLPRALREAKNRQQLSSLALLGQEFWRYPMAAPKPKTSTSPSSMLTTTTTQETIIIQQHQEQISTAIGNVFNLTSNNNNNNNNAPPLLPHYPPSHHQHQHHQTGANVGGMLSQAETPSDTTSSLSSFTTSTNQQLLSPESIDSVVLTMSPVESCRTGIIGKTSTFKSQNSSSSTSTSKKEVHVQQQQQMSNKIATIAPAFPNLIGMGDMMGGMRAPRPTPPNTLNLGPLRAPPAPPPRWSKPPTPSSPSTDSVTHSASNNFTVTTTVTFSVDGSQNPQIVEVTSPNGNNSFQTISKRLSPEGECKQQTVDTMSTNSSKRWQQHKILSPSSGDAPSTHRIRRHKKKESKHYQESDILESPSVYCRSALGDKFSDYEDIWTQENSTLTRGGQTMSSFRPDGATGKKPDLLSDTSNAKPATPLFQTPEELTNYHNNQNLMLSSQSQTQQIVQQTLRYIDDEDSGNRDHRMEEDINRNVKLQTFAQSPSTNPILQPRNRLGLIIPNHTINTDANQDENLLTPTAQTPVIMRPKQGSPFYAEPADALNNILLRRAQPLRQIPSNQRYSEPPKGPIRMPPIVAVSPTESEKLRNAGSLDELKKKHRKTRGRHDPWPVDSSWEFMGNDDDNDYDTDANWKILNQQQNKIDIEIENIAPNMAVSSFQERRLTIHQVMAKKIPELNLPELRSPTPPIEESAEVTSTGTLTRRQRISAYDNVEKSGNSGHHSGYAHTSVLNYIDSAQSDDGTVFSEPWDSSQWDSFLPQDDLSETIHLSKCRALISEDDTIIEESHSNTLVKDSFSNRITSTPSQPQKTATILRSNRCIRDREILCHPRNKSASGGPGDTIGAYTLCLAADQNSTFARNIENFISCTKESREVAPQVVMRNMRQFMSGMKNYLVKHGEADFQIEVQRARSLLKFDEFLNLDTILEGVMHRLVVLPLREHLYGLFVDFYKKSGDIQLLVDNIKYAYQRSAADFGIQSSVTPPSLASLRQISTLLVKLQEAELPLDKLELLLAAVSAIFESTGSRDGQKLGADDFLPLLVLVVAKTGFYSAEIEAEFMYGLLQPSLLTGEAGYYLTALCSAVHVLKSFMSSESEGHGSLDWRSSSLPASSSVLRVIIPDEYNGSLQTRTLPVRPHTTTKDVCRTIAHKAKITNPQDYGLFKLVDGEETLLMENECPQDVRLSTRGKHCVLAFKRIEAKIAWPKLNPSTY